MEKYKKLSKRIYKFLDKYASKSLAYEAGTDEPEYNSPDAYQMLACAAFLAKGVKPQQCFSEWGSGGYKPYLSKEGREEHDELVKEIYKIIRS